MTQGLNENRLSGYAIGRIGDRCELGGGMFQKPVRLTTDSGRYVVRGSGFRTTAEQFRYQAEAMNRVAAAGIRSPRVLTDRAGQYGWVDGGLFWSVCDYVEGEQLSWSRWWERVLTEDGFLETVAGAVAELHAALAQTEPVGNPDLDPALPPIQFPALGQAHAHWNRGLAGLSASPPPQAPAAAEAFDDNGVLIADHWRWLMDRSDELGIPALPAQVVHGDLSPVNLMFCGADATPGFIDWDCLHRGNRLYDALGDVLNRPPWDDPGLRPFRIDVPRRYLRAYRAVTATPIQEEEIAAIPAFCVARQLVDLRQRVQLLPALDAGMDMEYAALIRIRVDMCAAIRETDAGEWM